MYAHQVIDMCNQVSKASKINETVRQCHRITADAISQAQHFALHDIETYCQMRKKDSGKILWSGYERSQYQMPYDAIWLDWTSGHYKFAVLLIDAEGELPRWQNEDLVILFFVEQGIGKDKMWDMGSHKVYTKRGPGATCRFHPLGDVSLSDMTRKAIEHMMMVAETFLLLLNCRNVTTKIVKAPSKLNLKRRKNGKQEIFDYHVLNVTVPSPKNGGYAGRTEPLFHNRVHLCRGHFKEYTPDRPLFGHLTGLYWWQPHVRGQNKDGIVMKDYHVHTK